MSARTAFPDSLDPTTLWALRAVLVPMHPTIASHPDLKAITVLLALGRHPKPAIDRHLKTGQRGAGRRDVDLGGGLHACRRDGQRLECRETTAGDRAGAAGVVAPAH